MVEKIKLVQNPLTVIAIFAALAEIASTAALAALSSEIQKTFIWFVMLFPALLVLSFFMTLNWNPKVLYAPSDFRDDANFMNIVHGRSISSEVATLAAQLELAQDRIVSQTVDKLGAAGNDAVLSVQKTVSEQLALVRQRLETVQASAEDAFPVKSGPYPQSDLQARILKTLNGAKGSMLFSELAAKIRLPLQSVAAALARLERRELVTTKASSDDTDILITVLNQQQRQSS